MKIINSIKIGILSLVLSFTAMAQAQQSTVTTNTPTTQSATANQSNFTPDQVKAIEQIVHDYLVKNPQVLIEATRALQAQEFAKAQKEALQAIVENKQQLFDDSASPVVGNKNGDVVLVEFFDYQCGHCKAMNDVIQSVLKNNKDLKIIFKELPIFGSNSRFAARAALASVKQGKYFEFHDALLGAENPLTNQKVLDIAKKIGLNIKQLKKDMNEASIQQQIRDNFQLAQKLKLVGTPAFIVANKDLTKFRFIPGTTTQADLQQNFTQVLNKTDSNNTQNQKSMDNDTANSDNGSQ